MSASLEPGSEVETAVRGLGRSFTSYQCDFASRESLRAFIAQVKAEHPRIDILVNNAGTTRRHPAAEHPDESWDHVIEVNLKRRAPECQPYKFPSKCPVCGTVIVQIEGEVAMRCPNLSCPAQVRRRQIP